jgi:hypothetical protein
MIAESIWNLQTLAVFPRDELTPAQSAIRCLPRARVSDSTSYRDGSTAMVADSSHAEQIEILLSKDASSISRNRISRAQLPRLRSKLTMVKKSGQILA